MIELQKFRKEDFPQLIEWVPNARFLLQWAADPNYNWPLDTLQLDATLERTYGHQPPHYMFKAIDPDTGETIDHIELVQVDHVKRTGHIGRVLVGPLECRGRGYGKQILSELITFAFCELGDKRSQSVYLISTRRASVVTRRSVSGKLSLRKMFDSLVTNIGI